MVPGTDSLDSSDSVHPADLDLSFPGEHRLHAAADFSQVFAARRSLRGEYFDLHYLAARSQAVPDAGSARLGLVVAKKLARRAVQRNLLKRLAREAFRHIHGSLPPFDLVLRLARPPGRSLEAEARRAWRADIDQLLGRLAQLSLSLPVSR